MTIGASAASPDLLIVDADTHLTEPWDLWTSRAPAKYRDEVPRVEEIDGLPTWVFAGKALAPAIAGGVVRRDGTKVRSVGEIFALRAPDGHQGAGNVQPRLQLMDELGIWAHIIYPNTLAFGGVIECEDPVLRTLAITIYNDAMAELQDDSGQRLFPMGLLPWWDLDASMSELDRIKRLGLRGVSTATDPQDQGLPDLGEMMWDPLWAAAADAGLPLSFHIGAAFNAMVFYGNSTWPSASDDLKMALGSCMMFLLNARVMGNFIYSGILERHPTLNLVSVESGIGWIPFMLEALDYQLKEMSPSVAAHLSMAPSEYFKRQIYGCFWFEENNILSSIESLGADHCLFETDFPHPTCLYPNSVDVALRALAGLDDTDKRNVLGQNAVRLYDLPAEGVTGERN